jgi:hypothetical protein
MHMGLREANRICDLHYCMGAFYRILALAFVCLEGAKGCLLDSLSIVYIHNHFGSQSQLSHRQYIARGFVPSPVLQPSNNASLRDGNSGASLFVQSDQCVTLRQSFSPFLAYPYLTRSHQTKLHLCIARLRLRGTGPSRRDAESMWRLRQPLEQAPLKETLPTAGTTVWLHFALVRKPAEFLELKASQESILCCPSVNTSDYSNAEEYKLAACNQLKKDLYLRKG